ncbi:hypothetical protein B0J13DRAFT_560664 [Dactylonectria estremocensis]|uniref:Uncharacterized protein n=1 Tax=Dactylonectria estremocensis TaxID=1079267 RepID=A0A9P9IXU7_9HYPO|nr:hypothetical protein B0J13DRAFT_560664 [Dactylonectria estremocensis]
MSAQDSAIGGLGLDLSVDDSSSSFLAFAQSFDEPNSDDINSGSDFLGSNDEGLFEELDLLHMLQSNSMLESPSFTPTHGHVDMPSQSPSTTLPTRAAATFRPPLTFTANGAPPPKIGTRFSRDSVRILRNWLTTHSHHPFASEEDKEMLQRQTGLSKTQIANWLSNSRRRGKIQGPNLALPQPPESSTGSIEIQRRPGTPAPKSRTELMNPLERWVDSPPENEPATATAIARAMASSSRASSGHDSPSSYRPSNDGSGTPLSRASSTGSVVTSRSSGGSAHSYDSPDLTGSLKLFSRSHARRKKRIGLRQMHTKTSLVVPLNTFQCTFCTETFKTKHNWQRHEKSLHLALERWVCAPNGPIELDLEQKSVCVFCGLATPDEAHIKSHNYSDCQERVQDERTFSRKDHLGQHLRLVHNVKAADLRGPLSRWKVAGPDIRSRCGFCGVSMETWGFRADHLADHFKSGNTMADWKGDWGFETDVLARLENSIPPYFIETERNTPFPFEASNAPSELPPNAYELIELELMHFVQGYYDGSRKLPTSDEIQFEACRIILASEASSSQDVPSSSWLRDLIMSSESIVRQAKFSPMRSSTECRLPILTILGQVGFFESCPLEQQLHEFVRSDPPAPLTDHELQQEASRIIRRIEDQSTSPAEFVANWLIELVASSTTWLSGFRLRANISEPESGVETGQQTENSSKIDSIMKNYAELERRLSEYVDLLRAHGIEADDATLQHQAQDLIAEFNDEEWKKVALSNNTWLTAFKRRYISSPSGQVQTNDSQLSSAPIGRLMSLGSGLAAQLSYDTSGRSSSNVSGKSANIEKGPTFTKRGILYPHNANFHRWVALELARWVVATMSPNNPNQHVPTDEELQHQARWIYYDDDDPWNQTPADNPEWLRRFKIEIGILKEANVDISQQV